MFRSLPFTRTRTAPSGYDKVRVLFHSLRTAQLLSSMIVGAIMSYFMYHLHHEHYATPWTFVVLTVVSLLTVGILAATILFHLFTGLSPKLNLTLNTSLFVIWAMGFGMLSYWMSGTLTHYCDVRNWTDHTGIMVCRIYKTLFTFALLGLVSTMAALALDFYIYKLSISRGKHMRLGSVDLKREPAARGPYTDLEGADGAAQGHDDEYDFPSRHSEAFEVPAKGYGAQPDARTMQSKGYAVPEAQFDYDTGYHGGHAERVFGS